MSFLNYSSKVSVPKIKISWSQPVLLLKKLPILAAHICFHFGTLYTGFGICLYFEKWRWTEMLQFSFLRTHSHSNDFGFEAASTWLISKYSSQRLQWPSFIWIHYGFSDNWLQHVKPGTWGTPLNLLLEPCAQDDSDANNDVTLGCMSLETKQRKKGRPL